MGKIYNTTQKAKVFLIIYRANRATPPLPSLREKGKSKCPSLSRDGFFVEFHQNAQIAHDAGRILAYFVSFSRALLMPTREYLRRKPILHGIKKPRNGRKSRCGG